MKITGKYTKPNFGLYKKFLSINPLLVYIKMKSNINTITNNSTNL